MSALRALAVAAIFLATLSCASGLTEGDRFYLAGDLVEAERAYRAYLTDGRASGNSEARARYRLGLIYALPESDLHDIERAEVALRSLVELEPGTAWAQQAGFLLDLWAERDRLVSEIEGLRSRADFLLGEISRAREVATRADAEIETRDRNVSELGREIARLTQQIDVLNQRLTARQAELDRIKRIDLEPPP